MELNKENLYKEYIKKKQNIETVAKIFGVTQNVIRKGLKKFNIHKDRKDIFFQAKDAYDKTMIEKYGTTSPIKNKAIKEKIRQTTIQRYGTEFVTRCPEIKKKIKQTNLKKYGVECGLQNENIKAKSRITWLNKYGVDNPAKSKVVQDKMRKTSNKKYGVDNPGGLHEFIEKGVQTNLKKYGVDYTGRLKEFRIKNVRTSKSNRSKIDGRRFDSSYERDFYDYCLKNNIKIEDMQIPINYEYNKKKHITFIDFKVNGKFIECKGSHLLKGIFDYSIDVPVEKKLEIYKENNVIIITDKKGIDIVRKYSKDIIVEDIKHFR